MSSNVVSLLQTLIQNACVNDGTPDSGNERRSVETLTGFLTGAQTIEPHPGRLSAVFRVKGYDPEAPALMLMGHTDVVPVTESGWSTDPFGAKIEDGFVWGRGAVDMLNMTSAMAVTFEQWQQQTRPQLAGDLVFLAVADEEAGGVLGAEDFFNHDGGALECDYLLTEIAYPKISLGGVPTQVVNVAEKGPNWRTLRCKGLPGHASTPYGRSNALTPIAKAVLALAESPKPVLISPEWRAFVEALALELELSMALLDPEQVDGAIALIAIREPGLARYIDACTHLTVAPTVMSGGTKSNTIADEAFLDVDVRMLPGQDSGDVDEFFEKVLGDTYDDLHIEVNSKSPASTSPAEGLLWESLGDAYEAHTGVRDMAPIMTPAATDARFFRDRGVVAYGAGLFDDKVSFPDFLDMFHGNDEKISVESLGASVDFLTTTIESFDKRTRA